MGGYHQPVLLQAVGTYLKVEPGKRYLDTTLGGGGHAREILRLGGKVLGLDQDPEAIAESTACLAPPKPAKTGEGGPDSAKADPNLVLVRTNFTHLKDVVSEKNWLPVSGVLFDLGVSLHQITEAKRGFSFQLEGPLDMRMDPSLTVTAGFLVNHLPLKELAGIIKDFGDEPHANLIAQKIVAARPLETTTQLAGLLPVPDERRRVFQALRIAVNDELGALSLALPQALSVLAPGSRILVISFHSLEDRVVKNQFLEWVKQGIGEVITDKPVTPDPAEKVANPHSQSAKLRVFQKYV